MYYKFKYKISILLSIILLNGCVNSDNKTNIKSNVQNDLVVSSDKQSSYKLVSSKTKLANFKNIKLEKPFQQSGMASWYGGKDGLDGKKTASGDIYDKNALTAAHKTLPLPSVARITNLENNKSIIVLINDRGPYSSKRIVDVSERAADALNMKNKGSAKVKIELLPQESKELLAQLNLKQPIVKNSNDKNIEVTSKKEFVNKVEKNKINKIYIQVGSFKHPKNANNTAQKIAHLGQVKIDKINTKEQLIYRVRVGPIKKKQAKIVLAKVIKAGNKEAIIINKS